MTRALLILLVLAVSATAQPFTVPNVTDLRCPFADEMLSAVFYAEGGSATRYPYGVKSIKPRDAHHAREITRRSIDLNYGRWVRAGRPGGNTPDAFVRFMAARWCPVTSDPQGHANWVRNVRILLRREMRMTTKTL